MSMVIESFETFIDPTKCGEQMIEEFLEEHRDIRLYKIRLQEKGDNFLTDNKSKMLEFFEDLEIKVTKKLISETIDRKLSMACSDCIMFLPVYHFFLQ